MVTSLKPALKMPGQLPREERHVRFAPDLLSGSHRPPGAFRRQPERVSFIPVDPFQKWFFDFYDMKMDAGAQKIWTARFSAAHASLQTLIATVSSAVKYVFTFLFDRSSSRHVQKQLNRNAEALYLCLMAVVSPKAAIEEYQKRTNIV